MTDPSHRRAVAGELSIDIVGEDDHQSVSIEESLTAASDNAAGADDLSASFEVDEEDEDDDEGTSGGHGNRSRRKRQRADFPWSHTHDWIPGNPP